mmetsp:Transcript_51590/g.125822  ORF Transcript_51590/g.125822 Transcript_51590/m.125822 type:complete len:207 (-) Transcript_51590:1022-1642(-)
MATHSFMRASTRSNLVRAVAASCWHCRRCASAYSTALCAFSSDSSYVLMTALLTVLFFFIALTLACLALTSLYKRFTCASASYCTSSLSCLLPASLSCSSWSCGYLQTAMSARHCAIMTLLDPQVSRMILMTRADMFPAKASCPWDRRIEDMLTRVAAISGCRSPCTNSLMDSALLNQSIAIPLRWSFQKTTPSLSQHSASPTMRS